MERQGAGITIGLILHKLIAAGYLQLSPFGNTYILTDKAKVELKKPDREQQTISFEVSGDVF